jgi:hypothetical protein
MAGRAAGRQGVGSGLLPLVLTLSLAASASAAAPPHIVYALIDDWGWANAGWVRGLAPGRL